MSAGCRNRAGRGDHLMKKLGNLWPIKTERDHAAALREIEGLIGVKGEG